MSVTGGGLVGATINLVTAAAPTGVHNYLTGWYGCVSLDHQDSTLINHAHMVLAIDRDKSAAGQAAIIKSNLGALLNDYRFSPVFAGSNYPFGNLI